MLEGPLCVESCERWSYNNFNRVSQLRSRCVVFVVIYNFSQHMLRHAILYCFGGELGAAVVKVTAGSRRSSSALTDPSIFVSKTTPSILHTISTC
jgi:hypothetical protein